MPQYILEARKPVKVDDIRKWGTWFALDTNRRVAQTNVTSKIRVSTVFLGIDHGYDEDVPILFETMIFGGEHDEYQERYTTWEEAEIGHAKAVKMCKELL